MGRKIKENVLKYDNLRKIVQFVSFLFFSAAILNFGTFRLLLPVLWTWGLEPNIMGDAFTALQFTLGEWGNSNVAFPWLAIASFLVTGVLLGKSLCGWICPFGFIQDLTDLIKRKKMKLSSRTHGSMLYVKYGILSVTLFVSVTFSVTKLMGIDEGYEKALGIFAQAPFTALSPAETLFSTLPKMILNSRAILDKPMDVLSGISTLSPLFWTQLFIIVGVMTFVVYVSRGWCKYFCPHGAIMAILNRFSFLGLRRDLVKCVRGECHLCVEACPMNIHILDLPWEKFSDPECIFCLKCVDVCPSEAVRLKYP